MKKLLLFLSLGLVLLLTGLATPGHRANASTQVELGEMECFPADCDLSRKRDDMCFEEVKPDPGVYPNWTEISPGYNTFTVTIGYHLVSYDTVTIEFFGSYHIPDDPTTDVHDGKIVEFGRSAAVINKGVGKLKMDVSGIIAKEAETAGIEANFYRVNPQTGKTEIVYHGTTRSYHVRKTVAEPPVAPPQLPTSPPPAPPPPMTEQERQEQFQRLIRNFLLNPRCFIATAAYGSETAKELDILRDFRDRVLLKNPLGQAFVGFYYWASPPLAGFIAEHEVLRTLVREVMLDPIVAILGACHGWWNH